MHTLDCCYYKKHRIQIDITSLLGCSLEEYHTGGNCLTTQTTSNGDTCYVSDVNPPPTGKATCQLDSIGDWYIHVGGNSYEWTAVTDAMCLSITSQPAQFGEESCQTSVSEEDCIEMLRYAGCQDEHGMCFRESLWLACVLYIVMIAVLVTSVSSSAHACQPVLMCASLCWSMLKHRLA